MKYRIFGGHKHLFFETELQISSYSGILSVGSSCGPCYKELGHYLFESSVIHFHVIGDTISIAVISKSADIGEEAIMSIREMLENAGIEVKGN